MGTHIPKGLRHWQVPGKVVLSFKSGLKIGREYVVTALNFKVVKVILEHNLFSCILLWL